VIPSSFLQYLAAFYWATMMTTGLNVSIGPGEHEGQVLYEVFVTFLGICLQAYLLGAAASEIANMDATAKLRRQRLEAIKSHLRYLRVPGFLTIPIMEYYETLFSKNQSLAENDVLKDMPSSLKVQLAVVLNEEFLKKVPFFQFLEPRIIATLVLCMRARIYLPFETIIHQGDVGNSLFFIQTGGADVLKKVGEGDDAQEILVVQLSEFACFGEQSFLLGQASMATVRSVGYSEVMSLGRSDFDVVCGMFPALKIHVLGVQKELKKTYDKIKRTQTSNSAGDVSDPGVGASKTPAKATWTMPGAERVTRIKAALVNPIASRFSNCLPISPSRESNSPSRFVP